MWRIEFEMKRGTKWVLANQVFKTKESAEETYKLLLDNEYFREVQKPYKINAQPQSTKQER